MGQMMTGCVMRQKNSKEKQKAVRQRHALMTLDDITSMSSAKMRRIGTPYVPPLHVGVCTAVHSDGVSFRMLHFLHHQWYYFDVWIGDVSCLASQGDRKRAQMFLSELMVKKKVRLHGLYYDGTTKNLVAEKILVDDTSIDVSDALLNTEMCQEAKE